MYILLVILQKARMLFDNVTCAPRDRAGCKYIVQYSVIVPPSVSTCGFEGQ
jgi:hypothetical protein